ncbi:syntaxin-73, putative [Entamoeba invadens IP1]|uniref:Syntaxin-73, putative n=1 Tax=Entamoeba invadens IP1 TaxID=370355 RepID=A0A0A1UER6_ENTIV|nr:syntaxin-73, putative [Entamoeba invadens IP1]ELP95055.1 syntaxin-73, putative [Entamoeba invadens IP1]|eukprot:XP_004261826.1 syntaxin-73, putative [Entamoeba invadens IP1]
MNALTRKLTFIAQDCGFTYEELKSEEEKTSEEQEEQTEFGKRRHELKKKITDVKTNIEKRADMEKLPDVDKVEVVKVSTEIRKGMKEVIAGAEDLKTYHESDVYKNRKKKDPKIRERLGIEEESLKCIQQHIEQLQAMDRERSGMGDVQKGMPTVNGLDKYKTDELPDIEDDERFKQMKENDKEIDEKLDKIAEGVKDVKNIAKNINEKIDVQKDKLDTLEDKVDNANERLDLTNEKIKGVLAKVRGPDKMLLTIMGVCLFIGVGSIIAMIFIK